MFFYEILTLISWILGLLAVLYLLWQVRGYVKRAFKKMSYKVAVPSLVILVALGLHFFASNPYPIHFAMPPLMHTMGPHPLPPSIPLPNALKFLFDVGEFEVVEDIGRDPNDVPAPIARAENELVRFSITTKEVISEIADGISFNYWTYNGQVPGPMLRVKEGDDVEISLTNDPSSLHAHNIDLHAVTGPGGGAVLTNVNPGETKAFRFKALNPGLYVYHCATPNVSTHNSHGQYGLILVEPKEGLPPVDREFYVMQGELYTEGELGKKGFVVFDSQALLDGVPNYITFNGKVEDVPRMNVKTGEKVRIYVGNGGVNLISSFHIIGEIFDLVYPEGAIGSEPHKNIQTTAVLPGGASIVEFTAEVPGNLILVDHALARMNKGAWAIMKVEGAERPDLFGVVK